MLVCHRLGGLNNGNLFSHSPEVGNPRSRRQQDWFLLRPCSLACRGLFSPCVFTWSSLYSCLCSNFLFFKRKILKLKLKFNLSTPFKGSISKCILRYCGLWLQHTNFGVTIPFITERMALTDPLKLYQQPLSCLSS